jgi:hypothetical protein
MDYEYDGTRIWILPRNNNTMYGSIIDNLPKNSPNKLIDAIHCLKDENVLVLCGLRNFSKLKLEDRITEHYTNGVFVGGFVDDVVGDKSKGYFLRFKKDAYGIAAPDTSLDIIYDVVRANEIKLLGVSPDKFHKLKTFSFYLLEESEMVGKGVLGFRVDHNDPLNAFNEISSEVKGKPVKLGRIQYVLPGKIEPILR